jgi:hypothetical protein
LSNTSENNNNHNPQTSTNTDMASQYRVRKVGQPYTLEHRIYIEKDGVPISPFHDIPLYANEAQTILNMVVEIPRWTNGKLEVSYYLPPRAMAAMAPKQHTSKFNKILPRHLITSQLANKSHYF